MRKIVTVLALSALVMSCGEKTEKKEGFQVNRTKKAAKTEASAEVPVDLDNKGIGPITSISFNDAIDPALAEQGEEIFGNKCTACHMPNKRMIGPAMSGVYERRSPEWVMNMMLNPTEMIKKDPIAKALLKEYNNAMMTNQNLKEDEARALAEYLRTL